MLRHTIQSALHLSAMGTCSSRRLQSLPVHYHATLQYVHHLHHRSFRSYSHVEAVCQRIALEQFAPSATLAHADARHVRLRALHATIVHLFRLLSPSHVVDEILAHLPAHGSDLLEQYSVHIPCYQFLSLLLLGDEFSERSGRHHRISMLASLEQPFQAESDSYCDDEVYHRRPRHSSRTERTRNGTAQCTAESSDHIDQFRTGDRSQL